MIENGDLTGEKKDTLSGETDEGGNSWDVIEDHMANDRGHHHHQPDHLVTLDLHWRNFRCHLGSGARCRQSPPLIRRHNVGRRYDITSHHVTPCQ